jgi:hypothetical protein
MTELIGTLNDTIEVLQRTEKVDVELGRHFSTKGYTSCILYAVCPDNTLYRCQTFKDPDENICGAVSVYRNFEVNQDLFLDPSTHPTISEYNGKLFEPNKIHKEEFLKILQLDREPDEHYTFSKEDDIMTMEGLGDRILDSVINVYSPILTF